MPEEIYEIEFNYQVNTDDALSDLDDLEDEFDDLEESVEDTGQTGRQASRGFGDLNNQIRSGFLPILTSTFLLGGLAGALTNIALQKTSVGDFFSVLRDGVAGFIQAAVGPEFDQASQNVTGLLGVLSQRSQENREAGRTELPGRIVNNLLTDPTAFFGREVGRQAQLDPEAGSLQLLGRAWLESIRPANSFNLPTGIIGAGARVVDRNQAFQLPSALTDLRDTRVDFGGRNISSRGGQGNNVTVNFNGPVMDLPTVEDIAFRGVDRALNDPTFRGDTLTGGGLP